MTTTPFICASYLISLSPPFILHYIIFHNLHPPIKNCHVQKRAISVTSPTKKIHQLSKLTMYILIKWRKYTFRVSLVSKCDWLLKRERITDSRERERERERSEAFGIVCLSKNESEPVSLTLTFRHTLFLSFCLCFSFNVFLSCGSKIVKRVQ